MAPSVLRTEPSGFLAATAVSPPRSHGTKAQRKFHVSITGVQRRSQVTPPSDVLKIRPSAVDTDAVAASVARTADKSVISGNATRRQLRPSIVSSTTPPRPTTQHTDVDGAAPAVSSPTMPVGTASQLVPPLVERSTTDPAMRHRTTRCRPAGGRAAGPAYRRGRPRRWRTGSRLRRSWPPRC